MRVVVIPCAPLHNKEGGGDNILGHSTPNLENDEVQQAQYCDLE